MVEVPCRKARSPDSLRRRTGVLGKRRLGRNRPGSLRHRLLVRTVVRLPAVMDPRGDGQGGGTRRRDWRSRCTDRLVVIRLPAAYDTRLDGRFELRLQPLQRTLVPGASWDFGDPLPQLGHVIASMNWAPLRPPRVWPGQGVTQACRPAPSRRRVGRRAGGMFSACCRFLSPFPTPAASPPRDSAKPEFLVNAARHE